MCVCMWLTGKERILKTPTRGLMLMHKLVCHFKRYVKIFTRLYHEYRW